MVRLRSSFSSSIGSIGTYGQPDGDVGVDGNTGAAEVLLLTGGTDGDGVLDGA